MLASVREAGLPIARADLLSAFLARAAQTRHALLLHLLTGWPEKAVLIGVTLAIATIIYLFRFQWIERSFGLSGLLMVVFAVSAFSLHPDWRAVAKGLVPVIAFSDGKQALFSTPTSRSTFSARC